MKLYSMGQAILYLRGMSPSSMIHWGIAGPFLNFTTVKLKGPKNNLTVKNE